MLTIRPEQLAVFAARSRQRFEAEAVAFLRRNWARECNALGPEALAAFVTSSITDGEGLGLRREFHLLRYLNARMALRAPAPGAAAPPDVAALLAAAGQDPNAALDALDAAVAEHLRQRAEAGAR